MKKEDIRDAQLAQLKELARVFLNPMGGLPQMELFRICRGLCTCFR